MPVIAQVMCAIYGLCLQYLCVSKVELQIIYVVLSKCVLSAITHQIWALPGSAYDISAFFLQHINPE